MVDETQVVPLSGTTHYEPDDPDNYVTDARVIYNKGLPICVFRSPVPVNFAKELQNSPGWYAAPYSWGMRQTLLANGIDCPPMMQNAVYPGPFEPYEHQKRTVAALVENPRIWCLDDPRTGKTLSSVWALVRLMLTGDVKRVLILSPKTIMRSTWDVTLMKVCPNVRTHVADSSVPKFRDAISNQNNKIIIANHDKVKFALKAVKSGQFDLVIVDEVNKFRHSTAERSKALKQLLQFGRARCWFLTGTPTSGTPDGLYELVKLINPNLLYGTSYSRFRDMTMSSYMIGDIKKWKQKPNVGPLITKVLQPCTRAVRAECFDVPPVTYDFIEVPATKKLQSHIEQLKEDCVLFTTEGRVVAVNAGVLHSKIMQISSGCVYDENGNVLVLDDVIKARAEVAIETWQETRKKVIVLTPFRHVLNALADEIEKKTKTQVLTLHGDTKNRGDLEPLFQDTTNNIQFMVADPGPIQYGMTLSAADTVLWMSPPYEAEMFRQANDRTFGPLSTTKRTMHVGMVYTTALEKKIYHQRQSDEERQIDELDTIADLDKYFNG